MNDLDRGKMRLILVIVAMSFTLDSCDRFIKLGLTLNNVTPSAKCVNVSENGVAK